MLRAGSSSGVELFQVLRQFHSATISLSPEYLSFDRFTVHRRPNLTLFPIIHPRHPLSPPQPTLFNDISLSPPQPALFGEVRTLPIFQNFPSKSQSFSWLICRKNIRTIPILQLFSSDFLSCNMAYLALHFNLLRAHEIQEHSPPEIQEHSTTSTRHSITSSLTFTSRRFDTVPHRIVTNITSVPPNGRRSIVSSSTSEGSRLVQYRCCSSAFPNVPYWEKPCVPCCLRTVDKFASAVLRPTDLSRWCNVLSRVMLYWL